MSDKRLLQYVCPECGGPKSLAAKRCQFCRFPMLKMTAEGIVPVVVEVSRLVCPSCGGAKNAKSKVCLACYEASRTDEGPFPLGGTERARMGCIVSFENADGRSLVLHRKGPVRKALAQACDSALALDPTFLVVAISTPDSIYTDLKGHRANGDGGDSARYGYARMPEKYHLTGALSRMLHPRLAR